MPSTLKLSLLNMNPTTYLATNMIMDKNADVGLIVDSPLSI